MRIQKQRALDQIALIQRLKADVAETRLASATRDVHEAEKMRNEAQAQCDASEEAWQASAAMHGIAADVTWFWSDTVCRADSTLIDTVERFAERETQADKCAAAYRRQLMVRDIASDAARVAHVRASRKRDEARLREVIERLALGWSRS